uniref:Cullin family profile domain-containing protein n=1 Tax=Globodera rostochiensis TaxID=31243 RepID=A0A914HEE8_GLORO
MNLRPKAVNFEDVWSKLRETLEAIICLKPIERITWDHNFSDIYFVCVSVPEAQSRRLYMAVKKCLERHAAEIKESLLLLSGDRLLSAYNSEWEKFHKGAICLHNLYGYLNKQLTKEKMDAESQHTFMADTDRDGQCPHLGVGDLAFSIWRNGLIRPLAPQLVSHIIELIGRLRTGVSSSIGIRISDIRGAVLSFVAVNESIQQEQRTQLLCLSTGIPLTEFYEEIFERHFLEASENYYRTLTNETFAHLDCCPYMESVIQKTNEERSLVQRLLHYSTLPKVEQLCSELLVNDQLEKISIMCREVVQREMLHDLQNMYTLLKPLSNALPILMQEFEHFVRKSGMNCMETTINDAAEFVSNIQSLHEKFTRMITAIFNGDNEFVAALDRAIQSVVNHREDAKQPPKISEKLNRYIDSLMRTKKGKSEAEIDTLLSKSIVIFRYIDDKDLFQKFYSKMLSNRLIGSLSFSMDLEETMINKMKEACGYEFTSKLSRMFTDISISQSLTKRFHETIFHLKEMLKQEIKTDIPIHVMVLQAGAWPLSPPSASSEPSSSAQQQQEVLSDYVPPPVLQNSLKLFEQFYTSSHNGRKLTWLYGNSTAEVQLNYLDRLYQVTMSVYQFSILLLFSNQDAQQISQIAFQCSLSIQSVVRASRSLVDIGILITEAKVDEMTDKSTLRLNTAFTWKRLAFKVMLPLPSKPQEKETEATCNTVQQDRKYYTECAIVRVMKARKVMKHSALVEEVIKQSQPRFIPDVQFIKKNIESLIDKYYLQRTDQNDEYEYIS